MNRCVKRLPISQQLMPWFFRAGQRWEVVENGLPEDAAFVWWEFDSDRGIATILVRSESYPEVPEGQPIPEVEPIRFRTDT